MVTATELLRSLFSKLNDRIQVINEERRKEGLFAFKKAEITLLGQMSLLVQVKVSAVLSLAQTVDLDAHLKMDNVIKQELKILLAQVGLVYDEDSELIWIPKSSTYSSLFDFECITVKCIDAEFALLSKAVKAPDKNKQLIRQAIASGKFPNLPDLILENGGKLENFV